MRGLGVGLLLLPLYAVASVGGVLTTWLSSVAYYASSSATPLNTFRFNRAPNSYFRTSMSCMFAMYCRVA